MHDICGDSIASVYETLGLCFERRKGRISSWVTIAVHADVECIPVPPCSGLIFYTVRSVVEGAVYGFAMYR